MIYTRHTLEIRKATGQNLNGGRQKIWLMLQMSLQIPWVEKEEDGEGWNLHASAVSVHLSMQDVKFLKPLYANF